MNETWSPKLKLGIKKAKQVGGERYSACGVPVLIQLDMFREMASGIGTS